jgi:hypothetical protein
VRPRKVALRPFWFPLWQCQVATTSKSLCRLASGWGNSILGRCRFPSVFSNGGAVATVSLSGVLFSTQSGVCIESRLGRWRTRVRRGGRARVCVPGSSESLRGRLFRDIRECSFANSRHGDVNLAFCFVAVGCAGLLGCELGVAGLWPVFWAGLFRCGARHRGRVPGNAKVGREPCGVLWLVWGVSWVGTAAAQSCDGFHYCTTCFGLWCLSCVTQWTAIWHCWLRLVVHLLRYQ